MTQDLSQDTLTETQHDKKPGDRFTPASERVAVLAFEYWEKRFRPIGSPHEDWFRAERELRHRATPGSVL
jgi:hypothetical protein